MSENPNAEQVRYWNEQAGPKWVAARAPLDAMLGPIGDDALAHAAPRPGERALDVGCGNGRTTIALARACAGDVVGIDISAPLLALARADAAGAGLARPPRFTLADAQTADLGPARFDLVFSRFGVMFFADPVAAFTRLRGALAHGGRLVFVCWQAIAVNEWMQLPLAAVGSVLELPPPTPPEAPGPFAFADHERVRTILTRAGFAAIEIEARRGLLELGGTTELDAATEFALQVGPAAAALRTAPPALAAAAREAVRARLAPRVGGGATVALPGAWWLVSARTE